MKELSIGFLGFGEVGFQFSKGFRETYDGAILAYDKAASLAEYGGVVHSRADQVDVTLVDSPLALAECCNIIFAAVPAKYTEEAARSVLPSLHPKHAYMDVSAADPDTKRKIASMLHPIGVQFVDMAIVGPVKLLRHQVPIMASGHLSDKVYGTLNALGMQIEVISDRAGEASAVKLCRSIFTKGLEALLVECALVARKTKVDRKVLESIQHTLAQQTFLAAANRYITGNAIHAGRRVHEVEEAMNMAKAMGIQPLVTKGVLDRMSWCESAGGNQHFGAEQPSRYEEVIDYYLSKGDQE